MKAIDQAVGELQSSVGVYRPEVVLERVDAVASVANFALATLIKNAENLRDDLAETLSERGLEPVEDDE